MKTVGIILSIIGGLGLIVFGLQAMEDSESFSLLGVDIAVSTANWTPVIVSGVVLVIGLIMSARKK
ncbi:hypothetical protein A33Q_2981 [Indibacter alkaliphilus LW1]|jgi:ABC-type antimicrobial peptide transport system permease subunit|uniref:Transglycosylase n=1 Tax=Indibacter alkaliphilus (strain CCUG 57479 / KCTC 22604 / LW1) TaxID=1189612 RepID=S2D9R9_INDAL|nr:hypothetical protein [Indibacter alkaliphilus]EOZ95619.1 hypothetical protein A33Q_2981 [Indibacter alkaliphilus LW1]